LFTVKKDSKVSSYPLLLGIFSCWNYFGIFLAGLGVNNLYYMKNIVGFTILAFSLSLASFKTPTFTIDAVAVAFRSGNVDQISTYFDYRVDISLPEKSDSYSKSQAEMIIRDFFDNNGVRNFQVKQKGENAGSEFCIGVLQTRNGDFRTSLFMKQKGDKQYLQEIRFQPLQ
jgi:hypothetical protein